MTAGVGRMESVAKHWLHWRHEVIVTRNGQGLLRRCIGGHEVTSTGSGGWGEKQMKLTNQML